MVRNTVSFNLASEGKPYVPLWKKLTTAGRAAEGLRAAWRSQLRHVQERIGFEYIRFHGVLHDDMMIYHEDAEGKPFYNWQYLDSLYDFLLSVGIRPFVELSFMPSALASGTATTFWWKANITPPKDYGKWAELVRQFAVHCANRYGIAEVRKWYWEVWNEPNFKDSFWTSDRDGYFRLYAETAAALRKVDSRLRVGGPATTNFEKGEAPWVKEFLAHCAERGLPLDFVSTHPYPNDWPVGPDGKQLTVYREEGATPSDLRWLRDTVASSQFPRAEIHLTEWNASARLGDLFLDTAFMATFVISNNIRSLDLADSLGFWTFTDIFEESPLPETPFHGGFGMMNIQGLQKPSFNGYWYLGRLGTRRIAAGDGWFVTRTDDDSVQILMWNHCHFNQRFAATDRSALTFHNRYDIFSSRGDLLFELAAEGADGTYRALEYTFDREHGSVFDAWVCNGAPAELGQGELEILRQCMHPSAKAYQIRSESALHASFLVKPHGVTLVELQKIRE